MKYYSKYFLLSLLVVQILLSSCDDSDKNSQAQNSIETFELTIGNQAPMLLTGSAFRIAENTYQVTGNSTTSDLTITVKWYSSNPTGTFSWDNDDNSNEGIAMVMTEANFKKSYSTFDILNSAADSNGSLTIGRFGNVGESVEGSFVADNAYLIDTTPGTSGTASIVKVTGKFKVKRDL